MTGPEAKKSNPLLPHYIAEAVAEVSDKSAGCHY
jgi:hypothetical protein